MKNIFLLIFIIFNSTLALAIDVNINCAANNVYCLDEFYEMIKTSPTMEDMITKLPPHVKRNLTFKRGNNIQKRVVGILGPHGHKVANNNSASATPDQPRVIVWDERSGFTASWNSGNPTHSAFDRVDLYDFDFKTKQHRLAAWFAHDGRVVDASFKDGNGNACTQCHGMSQRPIFPMYPDWPQFYGEFNDEMSGYPRHANAIRADLKVMANEFQPIERQLFFDFVRLEGRSNPRYSSLFAVRPANSNANQYYPYRPETTTSPFSNTSRAFANRPNLRLGVLYNRYVALQTFEKIKQSPIFKKFPDIIFYSLLDCNWDFVDGQGQTGREQILGKLLAELQNYPELKDVNLRGAKFSASEVPQNLRNTYFEARENGQTFYYKNQSYNDRHYRQVPYEDLLKILGLDIRDIDIRFKYDSGLKVAKGYNVYDPKAYYYTDNAMDIGYLEDRYAMNPVCDNDNNRCNFSYNGTYMQGMKYFNSYFDGSATTNELLAAQMLLYLTDANQNFASLPDLDQVRTAIRAKVRNPDLYFETLSKKYSHFTARLALDREFFNKMDEIGPWIQLPFPPDLLNIQNRESFWGSGRNNRTRDIRFRHAQWTDLNNRTSGAKNLNSGNNLCWTVYDSMHARYRR